MRSRTIILSPGESFITADGLKVEARTEEQERREQALSDPSITEPSAPRAISITDLDDRIVIEVGAAELRLTHEEAARLFARGRDFGGKPQA